MISKTVRTYQIYALLSTNAKAEYNKPGPYIYNGPVANNMAMIPGPNINTQSQIYSSPPFQNYVPTPPPQSVTGLKIRSYRIQIPWK